MEVNGVPLHPLIVHAVVVFVPLGALSAILFALMPRWRWLLRWPTLLLALGAVVVTRLAVISGNSLRNEKHFTGTLGDRITTHMNWAHRLEWSVWVFAAVAVVATWVLPYVTPLKDREDRVSPMASLTMAATVLLPIAAAVVLVLAVITGDAGAKAVWKTS
jgi:uncharacterized membrane protein